MSDPAAPPPWVPQTWDGWSAIVTIVSGVGALGGWIIAQIYRRGYERGRKDQRRADEAKELRDFKHSIMSEIAALKSGKS